MVSQETSIVTLNIKMRSHILVPVLNSNRYPALPVLLTDAIENKMNSKKVRDSVVALFTCKDRVFVIQRQPYLTVFPGYHSFPGGKVDREDSHQPYEIRFLRDHKAQMMHALCREVEEELNFDLAAAILRGQVEHFSKFGYAITPVFNPVRFHARFYRIELSFQVEFKVDSNETAWASWLSAQDFMKQYQQGRILAAVPTLRVMERLAENPKLNNLAELHLSYDPQNEVPCMQPVYQVVQLPVPSNTLPPAESTNAFILGDDHCERFLVDPSPASPEVLARLYHVVRSFRITGVFLTHHHPDHHQFCNKLARDFQVPIKMSRDSYERICKKFGHEYFDKLEIQFAQEGDILTQWLGKDIQIFEIPGHDEGQLGLAPTTMEWFLVGDLMQGVGTVVIAAPEGNMKKYFASLERVISLDPKIIIPSHGIPLRTTLYLKRALEHRQMRERQILQLYKEGKSKEEMLSALYQDIDPRLLQAALRNIESHLAKLQTDHLI